MQGMPRDDSPYGAVASIEQEVPGFGRVKFTARRMRTKGGRSVHHFWSVESAELVGSTASPFTGRAMLDDGE